MSEETTLVERVRGGLLGVAVGDALGVPVEGIRREKLAKNPVRDMLPARRWGLPAGTWSDDTSLTLCLAASLAELGRLDLDDVGRRFVRWLDDGYWSPHGTAVGLGRTTRQAIARLRRGVRAEQAGGKGEWSNGNGSLMRILPVAVFFANASEEEVVDAAHRVSAITHAHPRSQMACGIYCLVAREALAGRKLNEALERGVAVADRLYRRAPFDGEREHFRRIWDLSILREPEAAVRSTGYVVDTLEAAFWCVTKGKDFEEAVVTAVNLGGDTDTLGAVVGGLAGLAWAERAIPARWLEPLARAEEIRAVADRLAQRVAERGGG